MKQRLCIILFHVTASIILISVNAEENLNQVVGYCVISLGLLMFGNNLVKRLYPESSHLLYNCIFFLVDIGLIILYRLDSSLAIKQLIWNIAGFVFLTIIPFILQRMPRLDKYKKLYIIVSFVMLIFTLVFGSVSGGSKNWISIGSFGFQPSEIVKLLYVFSLASALSIQSDKAKALNFAVSYSSPLKSDVQVKGGKLIISCQGAEHEGIPAAMRAECQVQVKTDGKVSKEESALAVNGATEATLYISAATNFVNYHDVSANESKRAATYLQKATRIPYEQALKSHIASYRKQYDRVSLTLESTGVSALETPVRVQRFMEGNDMAMAALMFQYGRYLLISSSQPGGQPANLQGIWNHSPYAPWDSKYTININAESNT